VVVTPPKPPAPPAAPGAAKHFKAPAGAKTEEE
jgi:hypothetical protein